MYNEEKIYQLLDQHQIKYEVIHHEAFYHMEDLKALPLDKQASIAKNLLLRDKKKQHYYLISVSKDQRLNLKELCSKLQSKSLTFASKEELYDLLKLTTGCVSPFGLLNDQEHIVQFYLDASFINQVIGVHPNNNTATVFLQTNDLIALLEHHQCKVMTI